MNVILHGRQTGRTCAMLHRAIAHALDGQKVMVVAANYKHAMMMLEDTARMERPSEVIRPYRRLDYFKGSIVFAVNDPDREHERGWSGPILIDHYVLENL